MKSQTLCLPVTLYIIWTIVGVCYILYNAVVVEMSDNFTNQVVYLGTIIAILAKLILAVLLCAVMDYLCSSGREEWAWFIVIALAVIYLAVAVGLANKRNLSSVVQDLALDSRHRAHNE